MKRLRKLLALPVIVATLTLGGLLSQAPAMATSSSHHAAGTATSQKMWGLFQTSNHLDYSLNGHTPTFGIQYIGQGEQPQVSEMVTAYANGETPFLELETNAGQCLDPGQVIPPPAPACTTANSVSTGGQDTWINGFGTSLEQNFPGKPVLLTFDHEMNGGWEPWGNGGSDHATPANWIAAWRHVETVIHNDDPNATFMFAPNVSTGIAGFDQYWPGSSYVKAVGLDGYITGAYNGGAGANYNHEFASSVTDIKALAPSTPFYISETGVDHTDSGYLNQIDSLVNGAYGDNAVAVMYFDQDGLHPWTLTSAGTSRWLTDLGYTAAARSAHHGRAAVLGNGAGSSTARRCTSNYRDAWGYKGILSNIPYAKAEWTSNPCGFYMQTKVNYTTSCKSAYSGIVHGTGIWDEADGTSGSVFCSGWLRTKGCNHCTWGSWSKFSSSKAGRAVAAARA